MKGWLIKITLIPLCRVTPRYCFFEVGGLEIGGERMLEFTWNGLLFVGNFVGEGNPLHNTAMETLLDICKQT